MRAVKIALIALLSLPCPDTAALARDRATGLEEWLASALIPYLEEAFSSHPRFRDEMLRFVVMEGSNPQPVASTLAIGLRDRVQDALLGTPGIRIYWHPDRPELRRDPGAPALHCAVDRVHYYVGLEVAEQGGGRFEVSLRVLDLEDGSWVSGFGRTWHGALTAKEYRAWRAVEADPSFLGEREVPFEQTQPDLLAARLAHELGCSLLSQLDGEFIAAPFASDAPEASIVELISNNLADYRALRLSDEPGAANARIEAQAHRVDNDLFQYWVTIRPLDASSGLPVLSASAYILFAEKPPSTGTVAHTSTPFHRGSSTVVGSLSLVPLERSPLCDGGTHCLALQTLTRADAVLFFLNHQVNRGLVRLGDRRCSRQPAARIARATEPQRFSLPAGFPGGTSWSSTTQWQLDPRAETLHVIAASDSKAARALARHIARLPSRCTGAVRAGLEGVALAEWLAEFERLADRWAARIDWRIIRVTNVY